MNFTQHELSAAFPAMSPEDFDALVADIAANGQRDPIVVFEDRVIDGWHRYRACQQLGIGAQYKRFDGDADPVAFVLSRNLHRRHLSASQRAMAVAACAEWLPRGRPNNTALKAGSDDAAPKSIAALAHDAGVGVRTMERAAKVAKAGVPEVAQAVTEGRFGLNVAADIAALPQDEQAAAVDAPAPKPAKKPALKAVTAPASDEAAATIAAQADRIEELTSTARELLDENTAMAKVVDADDKLAAAMAENKRLTALLRVATERVNGLMFEKQEMTAEVGKLQRQIARMKKAAEVPA